VEDVVEYSYPGMRKRRFRIFGASVYVILGESLFVHAPRFIRGQQERLSVSVFNRKCKKWDWAVKMMALFGNRKFVYKQALKYYGIVNSKQRTIFSSWLYDRRIEEVTRKEREDLLKDLGMSKQDIAGWLLESVKIAKDKGDGKLYLKAAEVGAKWIGLDKPEKDEPPTQLPGQFGADAQPVQIEGPGKDISEDADMLGQVTSQVKAEMEGIKNGDNVVDAEFTEVKDENAAPDVKDEQFQEKLEEI
jgi:hypothetical protein